MEEVYTVPTTIYIRGGVRVEIQLLDVLGRSQGIGQDTNEKREGNGKGDKVGLE